jgi:transitional endoplasmic reticulum ATPase
MGREEKMMREMMEKVMNGGPAALMALMAGMAGGEGRVYNPGVDRTGDKIIVPEGANLLEVIDALRRQHEHEEQRTVIHATLPVAPWDGAIALMKAIEKNIGVVLQKEGMRGADQIDVEVELGKTISVPWGSFELPSMDGAEISTGANIESGRVVFQCHVICKRRYEARVRRLLDTVREIALKESLHRGKAFSIAFRDEDGDSIDMPKPSFFEFMNEEPIFRKELTAAIERNIFVPIRHADNLQKMGESLKRGVLFAGKYGVGKTLLASHIARVAIENGWTFIYVKDSEELPEALRYAQQYQPVVVFAEDVDRIAGKERTDEVNELLNQLDGVDSKSAKIMTVLTSNHPDQVNVAMLRPGRIDLVLEILPPDAEAVVRMIRHFAGTSLDTKADLTETSMILAEETPARVREMISRAKLESLRRTGNPEAKLTAADLEAVAKEVKAEATLLIRNTGTEQHNHLKMMGEAFTGVGKVMQFVGGNGRGKMEDRADA